MTMTSPLCPFYLRDCGSAAPYAPSVAELNIGTLQIAFRKRFSRIKAPDLRLSDSGGLRLRRRRWNWRALPLGKIWQNLNYTPPTRIKTRHIAG